MRTITLCFLTLILLLPSAPHAQDLVELRPYSRQLYFTGFTRPVNEMILSSEVSGKCREILLDVGDTVRSPDVVKIDDTFIRLDLQQNGIEQKKTLRQLKLEEKTLARFTNLMQNNSTAQANFDEAAFNADNLRLNLQSLKAGEIRLKEKLARHTLQAPVGWQVIERYIEPGEYIRQGEPLLKLGDFNQLVVPFLLTYEELDLLKDIDKIHLNLPDLNTSVLSKIYRIAPDYNEQQKKIRVELITLEPTKSTKAQWRGGLRAKLKIRGKTEPDTYIVPFTSLISRYDANWVIHENGTQVKVILLGKSATGNEAIITGENLSPGDRILSSPKMENRTQ